MITTTSVQTCSPFSAAMPAVVGGAGAWGYGAWVEVLAAAATPITLLSLSFSVNTLGASRPVEMQIGIGGAGAETAISTFFKFFENTSAGPNAQVLDIPLTGIITGDRVSIRYRTDTAAGGGNSVAINFCPNFDSTHKTNLAMDYVPNGAAGVSASPGASWANGAWVEMTSGFALESALTGLSVNLAGAPGTYNYELELGIGAAAAEVVITTMRGHTDLLGWADSFLPAPYPVAPSRRIAARVRHSRTGTTAMVLWLRALGATSLLPIPDPPGGGDPGSGGNPATGTSLCGITAPLVLMAELELNSGTARWSRAMQPVNYPSASYGGAHEPRILSIAPITRSLSDWDGQFSTGSTTISLDDTDGVIRALAINNTLKNKSLDVWAIDDDSGRAAATRWRVGCFLVSKWRQRGDMGFDLELTDRLGSAASSLNLTKRLPPIPFDATTFPNCPASLLGRYAPWPYGILSDEFVSGGPKGTCPVFYTGLRLMADGNLWHEGIIAACATKGPLSIFGSDGATPANRVKQDSSIYSTDVAFPVVGQWTTVTGVSTNYVLLTGPSGQRRWTAVYFKRGSAIGEAFADGTVPVTCNLGGIEDVGDSTGDVITSLPLIAVHLLNNLVAQDPPLNANWPAIKTTGSPSYGVISTTTFDLVKTTSETRITGGYLGAFLLGWDGSQTQTSDVLAQIALGGDFNFYGNRHGQICASMEDKTVASVRAFVDVTATAERSYNNEKRFELWANDVKADTIKGYIPSIAGSVADNDLVASAQPGGTWLTAQRHFADGTLITTQRDTQTFQYEDWVTRDFSTLIPDDALAHQLARRKKGPDFMTHTTDLCGTLVELGDNFDMTHFAGPTAALRKYRLQSTTFDGMLGQVTMIGHDLADI